MNLREIAICYLSLFAMKNNAANIPSPMKNNAVNMPRFMINDAENTQNLRGDRRHLGAMAYPTSQPSGQPTGVPTGQPTGQPTGAPTGQPTTQPTITPSSVPTVQPIISFEPTSMPTTNPSPYPSSRPVLILYPSPEPTFSSESPSFQPTSTPTTQISDNNVAMMVILIGGGSICLISLFVFLIKRYVNANATSTCNPCVNSEPGAQNNRGIQFSNISSSDNEQELTVADLIENIQFVENAVPVPSEEQTVLATLVDLNN